MDLKKIPNRQSNLEKQNKSGGTTHGFNIYYRGNIIAGIKTDA